MAIAAVAVWKSTVTGHVSALRSGRPEVTLPTSLPRIQAAKVTLEPAEVEDQEDIDEDGVRRRDVITMQSPLSASTIRTPEVRHRDRYLQSSSNLSANSDENREGAVTAALPLCHKKSSVPAPQRPNGCSGRAIDNRTANRCGASSSRPLERPRPRNRGSTFEEVSDNAVDQP